MNTNPNDELRMNLTKKDWYIHEDNFGTSEEKFLISFINYNIEQLKKKYDDIYLLRNEGYFKVFRFSDGAAIEPDFVLFLTEKNTDNNFSYQIFIEPKLEGLSSY